MHREVLAKVLAEPRLHLPTKLDPRSLTMAVCVAVVSSAQAQLLSKSLPRLDVNQIFLSPSYMISTAMLSEALTHKGAFLSFEIRACK